MKKVLAIDLDGTLLYPRNPFRFVPRRNVKFLRDYIDNGGRVVILTARGISFSQNVIKQLKRPVDTIAYNGSDIIIDGVKIYETKIDNELATRIVNDYFANYWEKGLNCYLATEKYGLLMNPKFATPFTFFGTILWGSSYFWNSEKFKISRKVYENTLKNGIIKKVVIFNSVNQERRNRSARTCTELLEKYPEVEGSWADYVSELTPKGSDKAIALLRYAEHLKLSRDDFAVVGDSGNDVPSFKEFPLSFCMSHSSPAVKETAKHIIEFVCDLVNYLDVLND